ncbi:hypothetical protein Poli38472_001986 [Pythium oligandrum]|uniref:Uncharacterized protein n=1 Tax=Pythium oligandrum TaxID=41045 RepID=A0A8K1CW77_PYTOL|nr:hypothetical protein Poli38472_001986 [Pythium oligandrum]|eukprot:TMW69830.1 hypothetical protein Poli38472_001986 [Pythium oligandrum]
MTRVDVAVSSARDAATLVYELRCCRPLPSIDLAKDLKHTVFSSRQQTIVNSILRHSRRFISPMYLTGVTAAVASLFTTFSFTLTTALSVYSVVIQILTTGVLWLVLRYDLTVLVMETYEFWYMTLTSTMSLIMIAICLGDFRGLSIVGTTAAFELALMVDANYRNGRLTALLTLFGALTNVLFTLALVFEWFDMRRDVSIVRYRNHTLRADDVAENALATLGVLLVRNGIRKIRAISHSTSLMTKCITYRCRIAMCVVSRVPVPLVRSPGVSDLRGALTVVPLQYVPIKEQFNAGNVVLPCARRLFLHPRIQAVLPVLLRLLGIIGLLSTPIGLAIAHPKITGALAKLSLATTLVHCTAYWSVAQRQLLRRLFTSFDFVFVSLQFTLSSLATADMVAYDSRVFGMTAMWLWVHWVLTLDAVTPEMKRCLRWRPDFTALAVVVSIGRTLLLVIHLVFVENVALRDRAIFTIQLNSQPREIRVVPFLLGRMITTLSWSARLLWRLRDRRSNELLMLQGEVQYENRSIPRQRGMTIVVPTSTKVKLGKRGLFSA